MKTLKNLSDKELTQRLRKLARKEQDLTLEILPFLAEVGKRELYLAKGYSSLYDYCKNELGYSDASAWRRVTAAQAIQRCPQAVGLLSKGQVTMCALGRVHKFISPEILSKIRGKSKAEVDLIAALIDAKGAAPDRTRPMMVPKAIDRGGDSNSSLKLRSEVETAVATRDSGTSLRSEVAGMGKHVKFEKKWKVEGVVSSRVKEKLDQCKSLLSTKYPNGVDYETLFDELTEMFLDRKDPERRIKSRKKVKRTGGNQVEISKTESRYIPQRVKDQVWRRDGGRCAFVGTSGKRCNSNHNLQFDHHPVPYARGGPSTTNNLRLLCAKHNRYTAGQVYGKKHMEQFRPRQE